MCFLEAFWCRRLGPGLVLGLFILARPHLAAMKQVATSFYPCSASRASCPYSKIHVWYLFGGVRGKGLNSWTSNQPLFYKDHPALSAWYVRHQTNPPRLRALRLARLTWPPVALGAGLEDFWANDFGDRSSKNDRAPGVATDFLRRIEAKQVSWFIVWVLLMKCFGVETLVFYSSFSFFNNELSNHADKIS